MEAGEAEYGFRERSFDVFVPRLCCLLGSQTKTIAELGLMSADALELSCMIRGGMKVGEKRKVDGVISIADTALATWKVLQRSIRPLEILQPTSVCQSRRASEAQAVDQSIMTALSSKVVSATDSPSFVRSEDLLRVDALQGVTRSIHVAYDRAWKLWVEYMKFRDQLLFLMDDSKANKKACVWRFKVCNH